MHEWWFAIWVLLAAALCGAGLLAPFIRVSRFVLLAAPLAGILIVPLWANGIYVVLNCGYAKAAILSAAVCVCWTGLMMRSLARCRAVAFLVVILPILAAISVLLMDAATLRSGGPAILFVDGTDHAGYAQLADWLNSHVSVQSPKAMPDRPYESWPEEMFQKDPRFGSFGLLAILSELHGTSGIFSYDIAGAIVLAAACLGVAAVFADSWPWVILLSASLLTAKWFDEAHIGHFARLVAYPGALLMAGLVLRCLRETTPTQMFCLAVLAGAVAVMQSGIATSVLVGSILLVAVAAAARLDRAAARRSLLLCGLMVLIPALASGLFARMSALDFYGAQLPPWLIIFPRVLDLEGYELVSGLNTAVLCCFTIAAFAVWLVIFTVAVRRRAVWASALLGGPMLTLAGFYVVNDRAAASELTGWIYPSFLCGISALYIERPPRGKHLLIVLLLGVSLWLRLPRVAGAVGRYVTDPEPRGIYTESEINGIAGEIGSNSVLIDAPDRLASIFLLVEIGRREMNVRWSQDAWNFAVGYRGWVWRPQPPSRFTIRLAERPGPGHQFDLSR